MSWSSNNWGLDQLVHFSSQFSTQKPLHADTCVISHTSLRQQTKVIQFSNHFSNNFLERIKFENGVCPVLLTLLPLLYSTLARLFCKYNLYFLIPSPFHASFNPAPLWQCQSVLCVHESVSVMLVHLFCFIDATYK